MPQQQDFLAKTAPKKSNFKPQDKPQDSPKLIKKVSILGLILALLLGVILIIFGERLLFDLNRWVNPVAEEQGQTYNSYGSAYKRMNMESSVLAPSHKIYYSTQDKGEYLGYELLIHSAFIIPVFLIIFLLYYLVKVKQRKEGWRVAIYAYMVFAFWMLLHLIGEALRYTFYAYENFAIYIVLGLLIVILTPLAIFFQQRHSEN